MAKGQNMRAIQEAIARLEVERTTFNARIDGRIEGLREALRIQSGAMPDASSVLRKARRGDLKDAIHDILVKAGDRGVTAEECVEYAKIERRLELNQASVSSTLSRLKNDGVAFFDGQRYRLKEYAGPKAA
jgi:hypothetical protein